MLKLLLILNNVKIIIIYTLSKESERLSSPLCSKLLHDLLDLEF